MAIRIWDLIHYQNQMETAYSTFHDKRPSAYFYTPPPEGPEIVFLIINLLVLFLLLLTVGLLSLWQLYYAWQNVTTIESFENAKIEELVRRGKIASEDVSAYPYDLGGYRNLQSVLGKRWWLWWVPQPTPGDGIHHQVNSTALRRVAEGHPIQWPPRAYFAYKKYPHGKPRKGSREDRMENSVFGSSPRVRRGSEGYVVREWTPEERKRMVEIAMDRANLGESKLKPLVDLGNTPLPPVVSKDGDSPSESSDWTASSYDESSEEEDQGSTEDNDDEVLGLRQRRYQDRDGKVIVEPLDFVDDGAVEVGCTGSVQKR
ncbi:hypothetical protein SpCBS45565_g06418 [Spizellomyces sp. 'palustris']|nr:hypothetical protein SpCBS45565_g06418 [Spizellomyces sp. 'palustris']